MSRGLRKLLSPGMVCTTLFFAILSLTVSLLWIDTSVRPNSQACLREGYSFVPLQERLVEDGFKESFIRSAYLDPSIVFDPSVVTSYFRYRKKDFTYDQFLTMSHINKAHL